MKGRLFLTLLILTSFKILGQTQNKDCVFYLDSNGRNIFTISTIEAKPIIRENNLNQYLINNLKFENFVDNLENIDPTNSKTIVKIIISEKGEIIDKKVIKVGINGVAEQIFELMTKIKWEPANCEDKKVYSEITIPFYINLN
jgi:hypothetical protein